MLRSACTVTRKLYDTKVDIHPQKVDIQCPKVDFESKLLKAADDFSSKTIVHIHRLYARFGDNDCFGRSAVVKLLELQNSSASKFIKKMLDAGIIEPVTGYGKGKYGFSSN